MLEYYEFLNIYELNKKACNHGNVSLIMIYCPRVYFVWYYASMCFNLYYSGYMYIFIIIFDAYAWYAHICA